MSLAAGPLPANVLLGKAMHGMTSALQGKGAAQVWERPQGPCPPFVPGMQHCHIGSKTVVQGMWQRLGTSMDWSLAIHPYGPPNMVGCLPYTWLCRPAPSLKLCPCNL